MNKELAILEQKLKRLKINYISNNDEIVIGQSKTDYILIIGLIIFPLISALGLVLLIFFSEQSILVSSHKVKIIAGIVVLLFMSAFNFSRFKSKKRSNSDLKILKNNKIQIQKPDNNLVFNKNNILDFQFKIEMITDEFYEGKLYLIDKTENSHLILGFDDENQAYLLDDLNWLANFFNTYIVKP